MGQRRIIELQYPEFKAILKVAANNGNKIEPIDKEAWAAFVRKHDVPVGAFRKRADASAMSGPTKAVIIEGAGEHDGYYLHSPDDEMCMKFESGLD